MIVGNKTVFAIEWHIETRLKRWVFGHFRFWIKAQPIGNWEDSTPLNSVKNWMFAFAKEEGQRINLDLFLLPYQEAFDTIYDSAFIRTPKNDTEQKESSRLFTHYISHLGMSTFNAYDIVLIEGDAHQRLIWRHSSDLILHDALLPYGEMQKVARSFCYNVRDVI